MHKLKEVKEAKEKKGEEIMLFYHIYVVHSTLKSKFPF